MDVAFGELRQDLAELAISHERLAADDRDVQRLVAIDHRHEPGDQFIALVVGEATKRYVAAEMLVAVGVAAWTPKRTFACDFDREVGTIARTGCGPMPGRFRALPTDFPLMWLLL